MTMANAFFVWRNYAAELGTVSSDTGWEAGSPLTNILIPRPGVAAIRNVVNNDDPFSIDIDLPVSGVPIDVVAVVGTNIVGANQTAGDKLISIEVEDASANIALYLPLGVAWYGERDVQQYVVVDLSQPRFSGNDVSLTAIVRVTIKCDPGGGIGFGTTDPFRFVEAYESQPARFGSVIAGPAWRPANGIALADSAQSLIDNGERVDALDGAKFGRPRGKTRRFDGAFALLEQEEYAAAPRGFRELVGYCGRTRPLLCYPGQGFDPVYGFLADTPQWTSVDKNADKGVMARARIAVDEAI